MTGQLLWVLLRRHHGSMTMDQACGILLGEHRAAVLRAVFALLKRAMNLGEPSEGGSDVKWSIESFLVEWVALGGSPAEFWQQTPRSFVAIMRGMARAAKRQADLVIVNAWHTAVFGLSGYSGKLRNLSHYMGQERSEEQRSKSAAAVAFFHSLKARGVPVEITRH